MLIWALDYDLNPENLNFGINTDVYLRIFNKHYKSNRISIHAAVLQGHVHTADKYGLLWKKSGSWSVCLACFQVKISKHSFRDLFSYNISQIKDICLMSE